ncbi:hypothetical protein HanRHA438_Chr12g0546431 [Helianthus annuus]|nr:hypothetical protein HanRHA438_Chr12g0546431 [Helianthus annuus]
MQSAHAPLFGISMSLLHFQTTLLHLNPLPNPICQTLSPFFILPFASMYPISYHTDDEDVFPHRYNVILDASMCSSDNFKLSWIASSTARPPAWIQ